MSQVARIQASTGRVIAAAGITATIPAIGDTAEVVIGTVREQGGPDPLLMPWNGAAPRANVSSRQIGSLVPVAESKTRPCRRRVPDVHGTRQAGPDRRIGCAVMAGETRSETAAELEQRRKTFLREQRERIDEINNQIFQIVSGSVGLVGISALVLKWLCGKYPLDIRSDRGEGIFMDHIFCAHSTLYFSAQGEFYKNL